MELCLRQEYIEVNFISGVNWSELFLDQEYIEAIYVYFQSTLK